MGHRGSRLAVGLVAAALVVAGACSDDDGGDDAGTSIVIAAEEELSCADWITSCAGTAWGNWTLGVNTLPQAFTITPEGDYTPGPVLAGEPSLSTGPPMTVTYPIAPEAVWDDGEPITSADFEYLWRQIVDGDDIYDTSGYDRIAEIDTTDPKTAVVTFSEQYAAWRDLFGGFYYLLPSHLLEGKDRDKEMKDGYAFSGGPWKLRDGKKGWKKGESLTLVPNEEYWGEHPKIDEVTFQFITESSSETQAVLTGEVVAAYPHPEIGILDEFDEQPELSYTIGLGNSYEGVWINADKPPLERQAVRQALAYATDRETIVAALIEPAVRQGDVLESFLVPDVNSQFYSPVFERYTRDLDMVEQLMTDDGWERNGDGVWERDGDEAEITLTTTAGDEGREQVEELLQSQWEDAGFAVELDNLQPDVLFGEALPENQVQVGLYGGVGTPDPGLCVIFCSTNIPSEANDFSGQNWTRLISPAIDEPWEAADTELDVNRRIALVRQGQEVLADLLVSLPLYQLPTIFVWDKTRITGPLSDNIVEGPFFNLNLWTLKG